MTLPSSADRFPWLLVSALVLLSAAFTYATVAGALSFNRYVAEPFLATKKRDSRIAEAASLELKAVYRGRDLYLTTCTACHGPLGEAMPNLGKDIGHSGFVAEQSDSQLLMFLKLGRNTWDTENTTGVAMPPKGGNPMLNDDDLRDIVQYLRYLQALHNSP